MAKRQGDIDKQVERAFGSESVLGTAELARALRISEQMLRIWAKAAAVAPAKVGHSCAWVRDDVRRLLEHLSRRPRAGASDPPPRAA